MTIDSVNGFPTQVETFMKNDSIYQINGWMPEQRLELLERSFLRNQRMVKLGAYPIKYNPYTHQLIVYTRFDIIIHFYNSQTEINVDNGFFTNLTSKVLLNYNSDQVPSLPPTPAPVSGSVQWVTINDPSEAQNIVADYLIITDPQFFTPHSTSLQQLASHRAVFNGFDVAIVDVQNILAKDFEYESYSLRHEQKIRDFIKKVYDGGHAVHTYDHKVAFVLLVGDAVSNDPSYGGVPASTDPHPTGAPVPGSVNNSFFYCENDYYYSCITQGITGIWDYIGDLFIGRISADNELVPWWWDLSGRWSINPSI